MPRQNGAEMSNDHQTPVVIEVVKSSAMNKPEKRPIFKKTPSDIMNLKNQKFFALLAAVAPQKSKLASIKGLKVT